MPTRSEIREGRGLGELSLWVLEEAFTSSREDWSRKLTAEVAFALALGIKRAAEAMGEGFRDKKAEYLEMARKYARLCEELLAGLPRDSYEDVSTSFVSLVGVSLPEKFYLEYVRDSGRFPELNALLER